MAMSLISNYRVIVIGDGVSSSMDVDFQDLITADSMVHNKVPVGVGSVLASVATAAISTGTIVTLTWPSLLGAGDTDGPIVPLIFSGV